MKSKLAQAFVGLLIVAGFGVVVAATLGIGVLGWGAPEKQSQQANVIPPSPVEVETIELESSIEIIDSYSGMIRPMERFWLGFEIAGRVVALGESTENTPLDDGDRVEAGQVLAQLDDREWRARVEEAEAELERAQADFNRAEDLRRRQPGAISEAEFSQYVATKKLAQARFELAEKDVEDTTLVAPADAVISKRLVNVGESVNPQQTVFELLQVDDVLLVVGVPEAFVGEIRRKQAVHVELLARDRFGQKLPPLEGQVYRVAEAADDTTGLFEVEVIIPNPQRQLKPGLIALAHVVVDRIEGFRVPLTSVVFRGEQGLLFSAGEDGKAHALPLKRWIEQGGDVILSELPPEHRTVVTRGQHRLVEGRAVRPVARDAETAPEQTLQPAVRTATAKSLP